MSQVIWLDEFRDHTSTGRSANVNAKAKAKAQNPAALPVGLKLARGQKRRADICFDRREFSALMSLYSQQVAVGAWKDYALDTSPGIAVFSIFRNTAEHPLYTVCKLVHPSGRGRQYAVFKGPTRLKLADTLAGALKAFDGLLTEWTTRPGRK